MAKTTLKSLLADVIGQVKASPVPIRAVEYDPMTKRLRVEFDREPAQAAAPSASFPIPSREMMSDPVKFLPGTRIPDDNSPLDAMEIVAANPRYEHADNGI